jgi:hypothetical protein
VYAPFLFTKASVIDQRCNFLMPGEDIAGHQLAAVLTSTLFTLSIEVNGAASLGAGALEAPTEAELRTFPIFKVRALSARDRIIPVSHAKSVWKGEKTVDWVASKEPALCFAGSMSGFYAVQQLYADMGRGLPGVGLWLLGITVTVYEIGVAPLR